MGSATLLIVEALYLVIGGILLFTAAQSFAGFHKAAFGQEHMRGVLFASLIALMTLWAVLAATVLIVGCRRRMLSGFCQVMVGLLALAHLAAGLFWLVNGAYLPALSAIGLGALILTAIWNQESEIPATAAPGVAVAPSRPVTP